MDPILKWAGGKRQLLKKLLMNVNKDSLHDHTYFEPFVGGGALFLHLSPTKAVINDINSELIGMYQTIKEDPQGLITELKSFKNNYPENFEDIRSLDRKKDFVKTSATKRAARFIYLNKTCYNGLYRVNSQGYFNVPMGKYKNPNIVDENRILGLSEYLNQSSVQMLNVDFEEAVSGAVSEDFVYFDPPYDYEEGNGFTTYSADGFTHGDLERLKSVCDKLIEKGCIVMVSNNDTSFVNELFTGDLYTIVHISANRFINCDGKERKNAKEVIINGRKQSNTISSSR